MLTVSQYRDKIRNKKRTKVLQEIIIVKETKRKHMYQVLSTCNSKKTVGAAV